MDREKHFDLRYLNVPLPEDVEKLKWGGDYERLQKVIEKKLKSESLPEALRIRLELERELAVRIPAQYPYSYEDALLILRERIENFQDEELERLWEDGKSQNIKPPAIIVVGEVCSLSESLQWMEEKPLFGAKILVTRPKRRSAGMAGRLREAGAEVVELPAAEPRLLEDTSFLDRTLERLADFRWAVFTSPSGVELFFEYLRREKKDIRLLMGLKFAVIGAGTAKALCRYGFYADYMPENFYAKELGRGLAETILHEMKEEEKRGENGRGGAGCGKPVKVLLLRAQKASPALCEELARAEIPFEDAVLYRTEFPAPSMQAERVKILLEKKAFDYVTFTSESTVKGFLELLSPTDEELCGFTAVCIGEMTEKAAREAGMRTVTSEVPSMDSMAECMISLQSVRA